MILKHRGPSEQIQPEIFAEVSAIPLCSLVMEDPLMNAIVSQQQHVADGLWIVRVKPDSGEVPEFVAGQYAELGFPQDALDGSQCPPDSEKRKIVRRAYSIASAPPIMSIN